MNIKKREAKVNLSVRMTVPILTFITVAVLISGIIGTYLCYIGSSFKTAIYVYIAYLILCMLAGLVGSIKLAKGVSSPINIFVDRMDKLAHGDVTSPLLQFDAGSLEFNALKDTIARTLSYNEAVITDIDYLLTEISNGNLDVFSRTPNMYVGDFENILKAFRRLKSGLSDSFYNMLNVSEQVSLGSSTVSAGAQTLAQGTTEQASSIQELSASIAEISQRVKKNTEDSERARKLTADTEQITQHSVADMELARNAMEEISSTSKDIGKVIKAIDDIAFQTNILALNAAVEAARAGAAGKGFAVVADEVRNLSQKSAEAAKNTTSLIESSIKAVENGSHLVSKASESFNEVASKSSEVEQIVEEIFIQTQEQDAAISQISIGIDQVSSVIQINSATSEESAAASEELSSQAESLKELVRKFKLAR